MDEPDEPSDRIKKRLSDIKLGVPPRKFDPTGPIIVTEGMLGGDAIGQPGHALGTWLADKFNHNFDAYDKAIDSVYNSTRVGGSSYHHLLDGQHDVWSAFQAAREVGDQSWLHDMGQALEHLTRDTMSLAGINPFFSMSPEVFDKLGMIIAPTGITKAYLYDALTVNGAELLGGSIALVSTLVLARNPDPGRLSRLSGGCLLAAAASANPFLLPVSAAGMVRAITQAEAGERRAVFTEAGKGAIVSGSVLLVSGLVGGPWWLGCAAALMAGVAVNKAVDDPQNAFDRAKAMLDPAARVFQDAARKLRVIPPESLS